LTKMKIAFSGDNLIRFRMTYTNWPGYVLANVIVNIYRVDIPTVRSAGTRYFFLSIVAISDFSTFSHITCNCQLRRLLRLFYPLTGIRSAYFCLMRSASALRRSNGCSSLNFDRISRHANRLCRSLYLKCPIFAGFRGADKNKWHRSREPPSVSVFR